MMRLLALICVLGCFLCPPASAWFKHGSVAFNYNTMFATPWMGWSPYEQVPAGSQTYVQANVDALTSSGLSAAGYKVVKVDIWSDGVRDGSGNLTPNAGFTDMGALATYIKAAGLIPMMYTDAGSTGCGWNGGSEGRFLQDFTYFLVTLGYEGVMVDGCGIYSEQVDPKTVTLQMVDALNQIGRPAFLEIAAALWGTKNGAFEYGPYTANSWWLANDVFTVGCSPTAGATFSQVLTTFWMSNSHPGTTGPYHFVHASLLMVNGGLTDTEAKTQFALWTMLSAPLEIGCDIRNMSAPQLAMLKNPDAIAINQDQWALSPVNLGYPYTNSTEVYAKLLSTGDRAVAMVNEDTVAHDITVQFADVGLSGTVTVYDVLNQTSLGTATTSYTATSVPSHGAVYLRLTGTAAPYTCYAFGSGQNGTTAGTNCTWQKDPNGNYNAGGYADGSTATVANAIDTTGVTNPAPQAIYQTARTVSPFPNGAGAQCSMTDNFWNLEPGATYKIRLHFSENWDTAAGQRQFNVNLYNGAADTRVLTDFDIYATAGGQYKANVQEFLEDAPHGNIAIIFSKGSAGCPILNGAEAIKQ